MRSRSPCPNIYLALEMFEESEFDDDLAAKKTGKLFLYLLLLAYTGLTLHLLLFVVDVLFLDLHSFMLMMNL